MSDPLTDADSLIASLEAGVRSSRPVLSQDGTTRAAPYQTVNSTAQDAFDTYSGRMDSLFNDQPAYQAILKEQPRHRLILWMTANGHSPTEIATALGITKQTVYTVRKQPWFREMFVRLTTEIGKDSVTQFLKAEVLPSLQTLVEIRDNNQAKASDRRGAADSLLDRFLGKPVAKTDPEGKAPADVPSEIEALKQEQVRLTEELKAAGLSSFVPSPS